MINPQLSDQSVSELKRILESIHGRPFTHQETGEIGRWWLGYVARLADNKLGIGQIREPKKVV
jgi:hypothetical protein